MGIKGKKKFLSFLPMASCQQSLSLSYNFANYWVFHVYTTICHCSHIAKQQKRAICCLPYIIARYVHLGSDESNHKSNDCLFNILWGGELSLCFNTTAWFNKRSFFITSSGYGISLPPKLKRSTSSYLQGIVQNMSLSVNSLPAELCNNNPGWCISLEIHQLERFPPW